MTHESAARITFPNAAARRSIHLVYSRDWTKKRQKVRPIGKSRKTATGILAGVAAIAPLVFAGCALLRWMHVF